MLSGDHVGILQKVSKIWSIEQSLYYFFNWLELVGGQYQRGRFGRPPVLITDAQPELHPGS